VIYILLADEQKSTGSSSSASRNLWVSGLSASTRAADLKTLFNKHGKVSVIAIVCLMQLLQGGERESHLGRLCFPQLEKCMIDEYVSCDFGIFCCSL